MSPLARTDRLKWLVLGLGVLLSLGLAATLWQQEVDEAMLLTRPCSVPSPNF